MSMTWQQFQQDNPSMFKNLGETQEEKERRQTLENQQETFSAIKISGTQPPIKPDYTAVSGYNDFSKTINQEIDQKKNVYDSPFIQRILDDNTTSNLDRERKQSASFYSDTEYNMNDLDQDQIYQEVGERYLRAIGSDENIYEN